MRRMTRSAGPDRISDKLRRIGYSWTIEAARYGANSTPDQCLISPLERQSRGDWTPLLGSSTGSVHSLQLCTLFKLSLISRPVIKERLNIDTTGGRTLSPVIRTFRITASRTRNPPAIPDSRKPAGLREFALVCMSPKPLTEDPVLRSTIRHQTPIQRHPKKSVSPRKCGLFRLYSIHRDPIESVDIRGNWGHFRGNSVILQGVTSML